MDADGSPVLYEDIAAALDAEAGNGPYAAHIPTLARLLAGVTSGDVTPDELRQRVAETPALAPLLLALAGQQIPMGDRILSFGRGDSGQDAEIAQAPFGKIEQATSISLPITVVSGHHNVVISGTMDHSAYIETLVIDLPTRLPSAQSIAAAQRLLAEMPTDTLPSPRPLPPDSRMERRRNPLFVGREQELLALAKMLKGEAGQAPDGASVIYSRADVTASTGIGGIGKTQLANEFVHRFGHYFAGGVFWLSFAAPELIPLEVADCGHGGRLSMRGGFHTLPLDEQVKAVRQVWASEMPRLLIFDNCEDERLLRKWQPPSSGGCRVLVTSRRGQWSLGQGVRLLPLGVLSREHSIELLRRFRPDLAADDPDLHAIAAQLGDFPLALHLAGNYLAQYRFAITPGEYLSRLRGPPGSALHDESLITGDLSPTDHIQHVARTFALSFERLNPRYRTDQAARTALARARHLAPNETIPYHLMQRVLEPHDTSYESRIHAANAFNRLARLGLLEADGESGAFRLHGLLGQFIATAIAEGDEEEGEEEDDRARAAVEDVMLRVLMDPARIGFDPSLVSLRAHAPYVVGHAFDAHMRAGEYDDALFPQQLLDPYLARWGAYSVTIERNEQALRVPLPDKLRLVSLLQLGQAYEHAGQDDQALRRFDEALLVARDALRRKDFEGSVLSQRGKPLERMGRIEEALEGYERGLALADEILDRNLAAKILINMGLCYDTRGQLDQAIALQLRAIALAREPAAPPAGPVSPDVMPHALVNLASSFIRTARFDDARGALEEALDLARAQGDRALEAICLANLGDLAARCGDDAAAARLRAAIVFCREHEQIAPLGNALHSCAETLIDQGHYNEAGALAQEGLEFGRARGDGSMAADNATALCRLAILRRDLATGADMAALAMSVAPPRIAPYATVLAAIVELRRGSDAALTLFERAAALSGDLLLHEERNADACDTRDLAMYGIALCKEYFDRATLHSLMRQRRLLHGDRGSGQRMLALLDAMSAR